MHTDSLLARIEKLERRNTRGSCLYVVQGEDETPEQAKTRVRRARNLSRTGNDTVYLVRNS